MVLRPHYAQPLRRQLTKACPAARGALLIMKFTAFFIVCASFTVSAKTYSQQVTLSLQNASIETAFTEIKKQTGFNFLYGSKVLQLAKPVTLEVKNVSLEQALQQCFKDQLLTYSLVEKTIVVKPNLDSREKAVSGLHEMDIVYAELKGRVIDSSGTPLQGASVVIKGRNGAGIVTNARGEFKLNVSEGDVLLISFVGYQSRNITVNQALLRNPEVIITLQLTSASLEEVGVVINTGYQLVKPNEITGSVVVIDNKTLNQQTGLNILNRLNGVAGSVLFDDTKLQSDQKKLNFNIRGLSTIHGQQDPLIVLDNFPYEGDLGNINPNDIESVTILKDAAASSIWGTRAGNGVMIITTKKGRLNQPLKVQFNTSAIFTGKPDLFYLPVMKSADYLTVEEMLFQNGAYDNVLVSPDRPAVSAAVEILASRRNGTISAADSASAMNALAQVDTRDQFLRYVYRKAVTRQYALQLSGGSGNMAWILSASLDNITGNLSERWQRVNVHLENTYKPLKNLQLSLGIYYTNTDSKSGKTSYGNINPGGRQLPYTRLADDDGNPLPVDIEYRSGYTDTAGGGKLLNWKYYPLEDYRYNTYAFNLQDLLTKIGVHYQPFRGFDVDLIYQLERQYSTGKNLQNPESYSARNLINRFSRIDPATGMVTYGVPLGAIMARSGTELQSHNLRAQLNYHYSIGPHAIAVLAGAETRQTKNSSDSRNVYGYNESLLTTADVDFVNPLPTYITGLKSYIPSGIDFEERLHRFVSYFANAAYTFRGKYTLSASARKDASNVFGVNANDKWRPPFWSAGTAWHIDKEKFYRSDLFPSLKLRITYGFSGNVDMSRVANTIMAYNSVNGQTGQLEGLITQFSNPELRWERVGQFNIGVDFGLRGGILSGAVEYYRKKGVDLYGPQPIDYTAGLDVTTIIKNTASTKGDGIDVSMRSVNIDKVFKWYTNLLFNYNLSKTTAYYMPDNLLTSGFFVSMGSGNSIGALIGKPLYSVISYKWGGLNNQGNPQGYLKGQLSTDYTAISMAMGNIKDTPNIVYHGQATPRYWGSLGNTFSWKGWSMTINVTYKLGYWFRKSSINYDALFSQGAGHTDFSRRWQNSGDEQFTDVPSMIYPAITDGRDNFYLLSEANVVKGDHIRLQFINLAYEWRAKGWKTNSPPSLRLFVNAANLGILWKANQFGLDPDYPESVPPARNFSIGLSIQR